MFASTPNSSSPEALYEGAVVLRRYAFADRWYKINVTADEFGGLVDSGRGGDRFAIKL